MLSPLNPKLPTSKNTNLREKKCFDCNLRCHHLNVRNINQCIPEKFSSEKIKEYKKKKRLI